MSQGSPPAAGWLRIREHGVEVRVRVAPRASRIGIDGFYGDRLKIRLTAPPTGGEANDELVRLLARAAKVPAGRVRVVNGMRARSKTVLLQSDQPRQAAGRLLAVVAAAIDKRVGRI